MTTAPSSPPDPPAQFVARIAELAVSVPLELSARLIEAVPAVAEKVPAAADRVRREVVLARFIGKLAVDQGLRELRGHLVPDEAASTSGPVGRPGAPEMPEMSEMLPSDATSDATSDARCVSVDELALADYDHLSSAQIVAKLSGLEPFERAEIGAYERAHRHRRTILGKLEQLEAT